MSGIRFQKAAGAVALTDISDQGRQLMDNLLMKAIRPNRKVVHGR